MAVNLHKYLVWVIEEKSVSRIEWSWCPFACFEAAGIIYYSYIAHSTCIFLKMMQNGGHLEKMAAILDF